MSKNTGVGRYCKKLLSEVVGKTDDGFPIGLSYKKILAMTRKKFPDSAVDKFHLCWYAAAMRRDGDVIPAHRERSRWNANE